MSDPDFSPSPTLPLVARLGFNVAIGLLVIGALFFFLQLDAYWPFVFPPKIPWLGWTLLAGGMLLIVAAEYSFFAHGGASGAPTDPTRQFVPTGVYRWIRNPIYLGDILLLFGIAILRQSPTVFFLSVFFVLGIHLWVVKGEEPRTAQRFGERYREYQKMVPRWLPRLVGKSEPRVP